MRQKTHAREMIEPGASSHFPEYFALFFLESQHACPSPAIHPDLHRMQLDADIFAHQ